MILTGTKNKWVEVGVHVKCDASAGEIYLEHSHSTVYSLDQCKTLCEDAVGCQSITYSIISSFPYSAWCSLFSTPCTTTRVESKAVALRLTKESEFASLVRPGRYGFSKAKLSPHESIIIKTLCLLPTINLYLLS